VIPVLVEGLSLSRREVAEVARLCVAFACLEISVVGLFGLHRQHRLYAHELEILLG
jgi:hypothetical protein